MSEKLHRQFGHPSQKRLIDLISKAKIKNRKLIECIKKVSENCLICKKFKKNSPKPIVCLPLASKFNDIIALDLKFWNGKYFLVMVDLATRFCSSSVINNKLPDTVIKCLFLNWISIFGAPKSILSDNGREFNNHIMQDLGEKFNVKILCTAAESPWSNGVCERLNGILGDSVRKIVADNNCSVDVALAWAVSARNSLSNNSGFSPSQLVFGRNSNLPNVFENSPPALENTFTSDLVREFKCYA